MENRARILSMETGIRNSAADRPRIMLNVGGKMFETTVSTLQSSGPDSLLAALSLRPSKDPIFIDRDPEIFSVLLFLLRTNRLPSTAFGFSKQELSEEALYYGIEPHLRLAASPPPLSGIDASIVATIHPASEAHPSAFTADGDDGSVCVAHVGQISSYDWNLSHVSTIRTHLDSISSIRRIRPQVACMGSNSAAGLHFYDLYSGSHHGSISWTDTTDPRIYKARVTSICCSQHQVFASFNCPHGENSILLVDKSTLQISSEIGRQSGRSAKHVVPGKLTWLPETGLVVASAVTSGAFGYSGYVRIWDPRSSSVVWEASEPGSGRSSRYGDPFADVDVAVAQLTLFKLCSRSGDLAMADLRKLSDDPWVYLEDKNPGMKYTGRGSDGIGSNSLIHCYQDQVFVGREAGLEVWSRANRGEGEDGYRRNFVDKVQDSERGMIFHLPSQFSILIPRLHPSDCCYTTEICREERADCKIKT